jgi:hypothetical protein
LWCGFALLPTIDRAQIIHMDGAVTTSLEGGTTTAVRLALARSYASTPREGFGALSTGGGWVAAIDLRPEI